MRCTTIISSNGFLLERYVDPRRSLPFLRRIIPLSSVSPDDPTALHNVPQRNDHCGSNPAVKVCLRHVRFTPGSRGRSRAPPQPGAAVSGDRPARRSLTAWGGCPAMNIACPGRVRRHVCSWRKPTPHSGASVGQPTEPCLAVRRVFEASEEAQNLGREFLLAPGVNAVAATDAESSQGGHHVYCIPRNSRR